MSVRRKPKALNGPSAPVKRGASRPARGASRRHGLKARWHAFKFRNHWLKITVGVIVIAVVVCLVLFTEIDAESIHREIERVNPVVAVLLMATLPVFGLSIAAVYLVAGAMFGPLWGGVVVAGITAVHLLLTHWIGRSFLRKPLLRYMQKRDHHLPELQPGEEVAVSLMTSLVPGIPYILRNYWLSLSGIPLRTYFWVCLPVYVVRSYITLVLGDLSTHANTRQLVTLGIVLAVKLTICALLFKWLRDRRHRSAAAHPA